MDSFFVFRYFRIIQAIASHQSQGFSVSKFKLLLKIFDFFFSISQKSGDSVVDCGENNYLSAKAQEEAQILYKAGK